MKKFLWLLIALATLGTAIGGRETVFASTEEAQGEAKETMSLSQVSDKAIAQAFIFKEWHKANTGTYNGLIFEDIAEKITNEIAHYKVVVTRADKEHVGNIADFITFASTGKYGLPMNYKYSFPDGKVEVYAIRTNEREVKVFEGEMGQVKDPISDESIEASFVFKEWHKTGSTYNGIIFEDIAEEITDEISRYKVIVTNGDRETVGNIADFLTFGSSGKYGLPMVYGIGFPDGKVEVYAIRTNETEVKVFEGEIGKDERPLNVSESAGFSWTTEYYDFEGGELVLKPYPYPAKAVLDNLTNTIIFQNQIHWHSPGGNSYRTSRLIGHETNGRTQVLTQGQFLTNFIMSDIHLFQYTLTEKEKELFAYYTIEVAYFDDGHGKHHNASAKFMLN